MTLSFVQNLIQLKLHILKRMFLIWRIVSSPNRSTYSPFNLKLSSFNCSAYNLSIFPHFRPKSYQILDLNDVEIRRTEELLISEDDQRQGEVTAQGAGIGTLSVEVDGDLGPNGTVHNLADNLEDKERLGKNGGIEIGRDLEDYGTGLKQEGEVSGREDKGRTMANSG